MKYRRFGRLGWQVSDVGYGMWGMAAWSGSDDGQSIDSLHLAADLGCNFFDTAWAYGDGHSESLLGKLVAGRPGDRLYTATKIPPKNGRWPSRRGLPLDEAFPPDHIQKYVESSLKNAGLESFDLVQFHVWEDDWMDDLRWYRKIDDLRSQGLIRGIGISLNRWEPWNGIRTVRSDLVDAVQVVYNVLDQNPEDELFPACREHDVAVIARVPFDEGSLTGMLRPDSTWPEGDFRNHYFRRGNLVPTLDRIEKLAPLVPDGSSLAELALRFILSCPDVATVIPGMRKRRHVEENIAASDKGPLDNGLLEVLRAHRWDRRPGGVDP